MRCERTYSVELVLSVLFNQTIWDAIAEDGQRKERFRLDVHGDCWLALTAEDGDLVGVYSVDSVNSATVELHAHVLPKFREKYAMETGKAVLNWVYHNAPQHYQKLIAKVPDVHQNVQKFIEKFGFVREGTIKKSYWKGGDLVDVSIYGLMREDIPEVVNG